MFLWSVLTTIPHPDARPEKIVDLGFRIGTKVTIPFLDSRSCHGITLDIDAERPEVIAALFDYAEGRDQTLAIALKTYYRDGIVFHGPLHAPEFDYVEGTVELAADMALRAKHAYFNATDGAVNDGVTIDGDGMFEMLSCAQNTDAQDALNWPALGIVPGIDTTTESDVFAKVNRGDEVWQSIVEMADAAYGPDFELEPIETDPAELASGAETDSPNAAIGDNTVTEFTQAVGLPGDIGGLRLGIWATHARPRDINIDLVHPDGTVVRVYTGSRDKAASGTDFLGTGDTVATLALFRPNSKNSIYGDDEAYPHEGSFRSVKSLAALFDKPAAGNWKLRFTDTTAGSTGTLKHWRLDYLLPTPAYARLNTYDKPVTDDEDNPIIPSCRFHAAGKAANSRIFKVKPQGDLVRNQFIATSKQGTKIRVNDAARADYGTYQGWEAANENDSLAMLAARADAEVKAYNRPVPQLELAPVDDTGDNGTLRYGENFKEGGHVRATGKRGERDDGGPRAFHDALARVVNVTLEQLDSSVQTDLDVIPSVGVGAELGDG